MKTVNRLFIVESISVLLFLLFGCGGSSTTTVTKIYLQDAWASGPINQAPIHISEKDNKYSFTISPRVSYVSSQQINAAMSGHTPVNSSGYFQVDTVFHSNNEVSYYQTRNANIYEYKGNNLTWDITSISAGIDIDGRFANNFAAFGGVNYSSANDNHVWGGTAGLAYLLASDNIGFRLDVGMHIQSIAYDAHTVEIVQTTTSGHTSEDVVFYHDLGKSTHWDPFINLTLNSTFETWPVNFFMNIGFSQQTLIGFTPKDKDEEHYNDLYNDYHHDVVEDLRGESTASYINFTPGLYYRIGETSRILLGVRFFFDNGLNNASEASFILPMLQADFML